MNEAERLYRQVLAVDPRNADSLHLLGGLAYQLGRHDLAVDAISKAIAINAKAPEYHSNLGLTLKAQGKLDEAVACYRQALVLKPDYAEAHNNLALLLMVQGKVVTALNIIKQSLQIKEAAETKKIFVDCVKRLRCTNDNSEIRIAMVRALTEPWGRPSQLGRVAPISSSSTRKSASALHEPPPLGLGCYPRKICSDQTASPRLQPMSCSALYSVRRRFPTLRWSVF